MLFLFLTSKKSTSKTSLPYSYGWFLFTRVPFSIKSYLSFFSDKFFSNPGLLDKFCPVPNMFRLFFLFFSIIGSFRSVKPRSIENLDPSAKGTGHPTRTQGHLTYSPWNFIQKKEDPGMERGWGLVRIYGDSFRKKFWGRRYFFT